MSQKQPQLRKNMSASEQTKSDKSSEPQILITEEEDTAKAEAEEPAISAEAPSNGNGDVKEQFVIEEDKKEPQKPHNDLAFFEEDQLGMKPNVEDTQADLSEKQLVARVQRARDKSFEEFIKKYHDMVYGTAFRLLNNSGLCPSIVEDVFRTVFRTISHVKKVDVTVWLYQLTIEKICTTM